MAEVKSWDQSVFNTTLKQYLEVNKSRTLRQIVNTKQWFISRKTTWFTRKADPGRIKAQLGQMVSVNRLTKKGKTVKSRKLVLVQSTQTPAPLAALIINKRMGLAGKKGLYGRVMAKAITKMIGGRLRSVRFILSGWLPAIKKLAPFADRRGAPAMDTGARQIGRAKGDAIPAGPGWNPVSKIVNLASAKHNQRDALERIGGKGLQRAFDDEAASMVQYIESKMKPDADAFNRAQRG